MPIYLETSKSSYIFDHAKPDNPNIPFFPTSEEYKQSLLQDLPAGSQPDRNRVWLVEPGIYSIEVYEAIIMKTLGSCLPPLERYICKSGVVQTSRRRHPYVPITPIQDARLREERDICFTLLSMAENLSIINWMNGHGILSYPNPLISTPYGCIWLLPSTEEKYEIVYEELGIDTSYPRSILPLGIILIGAKSMWEWAFPGRDGVARNGRATDDGGLQRIEWPTHDKTDT